VTAVNLIASGDVAFVINTPQGRGGRTDGEAIRKAANVHRVSSVTTVEAALAAVRGMAEQLNHPLEVRSTAGASWSVTPVVIRRRRSTWR